MPRNSRTLSVLVVLIALSAVLRPAAAQAQRRRLVRVLPSRPVVFVAGYYSYPFYPWRGWYPYYPPFGFYPGGYEYAAALRIQVTPREAEVYVDGGRAGIVDDFDGIFQSLRLLPGQHDIVLYLDGFRSVSQSLYLEPGSTFKLRYTMTPLVPGEPNDPRPVPSGSYPPPMPPRAAAPAPSPLAASASFGTLSIRVQPAGADVVIDRDHWVGPETGNRLIVYVPEGTHRVEISLEGYHPFVTDVQVRRGETASLNVSLPLERR